MDGAARAPGRPARAKASPQENASVRGHPDRIAASGLGSIFKGEPRLLIEDGPIQHEAMRKASISSADLQQALRLQGRTDPTRISRAYLEGNAAISIIPCPTEPEVLEVSDEDGITTIRIRLE